MSLIISDITPKCIVMVLFKRDDGERFLLGDGDYEFNSSQAQFEPDEIVNDVVELQGTDGQMITGQARRSASQTFKGYIGDQTTKPADLEEMRAKFVNFFLTDHKYEVVYITNLEYYPTPPSADSIPMCLRRSGGYLTMSPTSQFLRFSGLEYEVSLAFEDVNYYYYMEDSSTGDMDYITKVTKSTGAVTNYDFTLNTNPSNRPYYPIIVVAPKNSSLNPYSYNRLDHILINWTDKDGVSRSMRVNQAYSGDALEKEYVIDCLNKTVMMTNRNGQTFNYTGYTVGDFPILDLPRSSTTTLSFDIYRANYQALDCEITVKGNPIWQ